MARAWGGQSVVVLPRALPHAHKQKKMTPQGGAHPGPRSTQANYKTKARYIYVARKRKNSHHMHSREYINTARKIHDLQDKSKEKWHREKTTKEAKTSRNIYKIWYIETILPRGITTLRWRTCFALFITWLLSTTFSKLINTFPHHKATPTTLLTKLQQAIQILETNHTKPSTS